MPRTFLNFLNCVLHLSLKFSKYAHYPHKKIICKNHVAFRHKKGQFWCNLTIIGFGQNEPNPIYVFQNVNGWHPVPPLCAIAQYTLSPVFGYHPPPDVTYQMKYLIPLSGGGLWHIWSHKTVVSDKVAYTDCLQYEVIWKLLVNMSNIADRHQAKRSAYVDQQFSIVVTQMPTLRPTQNKLSLACVRSLHSKWK